MLKYISGVKNQLPLYYFERLSEIPRGSGNEKEVANYIANFAKKKGLYWHMDEHLNVFVRRAASKGRENESPILLQAHTDMVCEKNKGTVHDFAKDPIKLVQEGNILHTIFYYFYNSVNNISPYFAVIILYIFVLIIEFFIPSASAKAVLIIPMLTLAPIEGISKTVIILTYLFADGYTNVLYPTCGTLLVGLGLANVSFAEWFKKTILFQLLLMILSIAFLMFAVFIKL